MYKTWYPWVMDAVRATYTTGHPSYQVSDLQSAISQYRASLGPLAPAQDTPGISSLYGAANAIAKASYALSQAADTDVLTSQMVAQDLFGRSAAEQAANPMYRAVIQATYIDESGAQVEGTFTQFYHQRLPPTVGSLRQHVTLDVQDQLATPPPTGTPRSGQLVSVGQIILTAV
jgi:hypothetical protein